MKVVWLDRIRIVWYQHIFNPTYDFWKPLYKFNKRELINVSDLVEAGTMSLLNKKDIKFFEDNPDKYKIEYFDDLSEDQEYVISLF